jgi:hypothetical protein
MLTLVENHEAKSYQTGSNVMHDYILMKEKRIFFHLFDYS